MRTADTAVPASMVALRVLLASLFIFVVTMMGFVNTVNAKFLNWDDDAYVTENPLVQSLSSKNIEKIIFETHYYAWIPVTLLSHALDVTFWGMNPKGHHLTNALLHASNALFLFLLCLMLYDARRKAEQSETLRLTSSVIVGATFAAFLFSMHPQRVESVAWVSGRKDLLCALFLIWSAIGYVRWRSSGKSVWRNVSIVTFALGLLSKPAAVLFPFVLMVIEVWLARSSSAREKTIAATLKDLIPYFVLSVIAGVIAVVAASGGKEDVISDLTFVEKLLLPFYSICFYLWKLVAPVNLSPVYPELERLLLFASPLMLAAIVFGCRELMLQRRAGLAIALTSYALFVLPVLLGLRTGMQPLADRYSYLSTISIFVFVGGGVEWLWRKSSSSSGKIYQRELLAAILLALSAASAYRTIRHTAIWNNSVSLWSQALRNAPATKEEFEVRKPYMTPDYLDARINLGTAFYAEGEKEKAWDQFETVLAFDSSNADAHYNLGMLLAEGGDPEGARSAFARTLVFDPSYAKAYHNLGTLLAQQDSSASIEMFRRAARLGVSESQIHLRLRGMRW